MESLFERCKGLFGITRLSDHQLEIPIMGFRFHQKPIVDHLSDTEDINDFVDDVLYCYSCIKNFVQEMITSPGLKLFPSQSDIQLFTFVQIRLYYLDDDESEKERSLVMGTKYKTII